MNANYVLIFQLSFFILIYFIFTEVVKREEANKNLQLIEFKYQNYQIYLMKFIFYRYVM